MSQDLVIFKFGYPVCFLENSLKFRTLIGFQINVRPFKFYHLNFTLFMGVLHLFPEKCIYIIWVDLLMHISGTFEKNLIPLRNMSTFCRPLKIFATIFRPLKIDVPINWYFSSETPQIKWFSRFHSKNKENIYIFTTP